MKKQLIILVILILALVASYALPKPHYTSPKILSELKIPTWVNDWRGKDISKELDLNTERYGFISEAVARAYCNKYGENLLLLVLDAGNFHNPKVCLGSSGYTPKELNNIEFASKGNSFKINAVYFQKGGEGLLVVYWLCIDKKIVDWTQQKITQLWYSLFNKQKIGLMIRLDIPTKPDKLNDSLANAKDFIEGLQKSMSPAQAEYIFGKSNK